MGIMHHVRRKRGLIKIDFLVTKKKPETVIKNEIGSFFLGNNIFEYKLPKDALNTGTFYKAVSYACLYRTEISGDDEEESLGEDIIISLVREQKPVKLLKQLSKKYEIVKKSDGIYRINGMLFPMQILVTQDLDKKLHVWVTSLTRSLDREMAQMLLGSYAALDNETDRENADSVMNVTSEANIKRFKELIQEGDETCEKLKEILAPEIMEFKIRLTDKDAELADNAAKLADKDAEIAKLKKILAEAGIKI